MKPSLTMVQKKYKSIGHCIFCMDQQLPPKPLTDEHILPLALNGSLLFIGATCEPCAKYGNKTYENPALQRDLLVPRLLLALNRRKKKVHKRLPLLGGPAVDISVLGREGFDIEVPPDEYPPFAVLPSFDPPGLLTGNNPNGALLAITMWWLDLRAAAPPYKGTAEFKVCQPTQPWEFALTLAKIAYCYAVAERGLGSFDGSGLRANLLGEANDLFLYVGESRLKLCRNRQHLHWLTIRVENGWMIVAVQLFASLGGHTYDVIVGKAVDKVAALPTPT